jgi:hypothetical protein
MRKMHTAKGEPLYPKVKAKIFLPGNLKHVVKELRAPAGRGITADGIDKWLKEISDAIEKQFPGHEYRLVSLGANSFNFVWERQLPVPETEVAEITELVTQSA